MDITVTTHADAAEQKNVEQETRIVADSMAHIAIHIGKGVYLHLLVFNDGLFSLSTGDYRLGNHWLETEVVEANAVALLAKAISERSDDRKMYERLYNRIMNDGEFNLKIGDEVIDLLMRFGFDNHVAGPEWGGGGRMTIGQRRAKEWQEEHQS